MHHHIAVVYDDPALPGLPLPVPAPVVLVIHCFESGVRQRIEHSIAGSRAQDEVVCERCDLPNIEKEDLFAFLAFKRFHNSVRQVKCVQVSPQNRLMQVADRMARVDRVLDLSRLMLIRRTVKLAPGGT